MGTLQALLTEMSGLKKPRGFLNKHVRRLARHDARKPPPKYRILMMMATNLPDVLDPALLRPGRIDRMYKVGYPSSDGRQRTYEGYLAKVSHDLTDEQVRRLAVISPQATGASIKDIVNEALVIAIRDGRDTITCQDIIKAKHLKTHGPAEDWSTRLGGPRRRRPRGVPRRRRLPAAASARRSTSPRSSGAATPAASCRPIPLEDQFVDWRREYEADIRRVARLARRRADVLRRRQLLGRRRRPRSRHAGSSCGWTASRAWATRSRRTGQHARPASAGARRSSSRTAPTAQFLETDFGAGSRPSSTSCSSGSRELLEDDRDHVLAVAHALETHKTISGEDIAAIVEGTSGPLVDGAVPRPGRCAPSSRPTTPRSSTR